MNAKTLPTLTLLLAAATSAAAQQPHTPELVAPPATSASDLVPRQLRPANRALALKPLPPATVAPSATSKSLPASATGNASEPKRVVPAVGNQQVQSAASPAGKGNVQASYQSQSAETAEVEAEPPVPGPKFSLIPACPSVVPSQMLQLVDKSRDEKPEKKDDLAHRLREASGEGEPFYYGVDAAQMPPEPIPPGLKKPGSAQTTAPQLDINRGPHGQLHGGHCESDCCEDCCDDCCSCGDCCSCCDDFWRHRNTAFGEFLVLEATGTDVRFAQRQPGGAGGLIESVDEDFDSGYRVGFSKAITDCVSLGASFAQFRSHSVGSLAESNDGDNDVRSLVLYPGTPAAGDTTGFAEAFHDSDFQTVDLELSWLMTGSSRHAVNGIVGARYGQLEQNFLQHGAYGQPPDEVEAETDIEFHGTGMRLGLDARRRTGQTPLSFYGKTLINVLFGEFSSEFQQVNYASQTTDAAVSWHDERVVPVLECELGAVWTEGHWRLTTGYQAAFWFNAVTTPAFLDAVQTDDYAGVGETITFHGLVTRLEFRY